MNQRRATLYIFFTRTEAEERLKYLIDRLGVGVDDQLEEAAKMLHDTFLSELKEE